MLEIFILTIKNIHAAIGSSMIQTKRHGYTMVSCFVQDGIKKAKQFIENGYQINKGKQMKQLSIKDYSSAYEYQQAKKQAIKQSNALKSERKNKRIVNFN